MKVLLVQDQQTPSTIMPEKEEFNYDTYTPTNDEEYHRYHEEGTNGYTTEEYGEYPQQFSGENYAYGYEDSDERL